MRPGRAADHSHTSSAAVMEQYSYTSTHPLGHTGRVTGSLLITKLHASCTSDVDRNREGNCLHILLILYGSKQIRLLPNFFSRCLCCWNY